MFKQLKEDIQTIRTRDPAARSAIEIMLLYNGLKAVRSHRRANWCSKHGFKFLARWISQRCVRRTNIEIHPDATIGKRLFIDHGTGVVIGETTEIGENCTIYQRRRADCIVELIMIMQRGTSFCLIDLTGNMTDDFLSRLSGSNVKE